MNSIMNIQTDPLQNLLQSIDWNIQWYKRHARISKWFHYFSQSGLIIIPLVAAGMKRVFPALGDISFIAMLVSSAIAGLTSLFSPYKRWKDFKSYEISLNFMKFEIITRTSALQSTNGGKFDSEYERLIMQFTEEYKKILISSSDQFFSAQDDSKQNSNEK